MEHSSAFSGATEASATSKVAFRTSQGPSFQGTVKRLLPQAVTFEVNGPFGDFRLSEVLAEFQVLADERLIYNGRATVTGVVNTGEGFVCEATLGGSLLDLDLSGLQAHEKHLRVAFDAFLKRWQKFYAISSEYKIAVADLQDFLHEMRLWLDEVELGVRALPTGHRHQIEREIVEELRGPCTAPLVAMFERFEVAAASVPADLVPIHGAFCRQQLHPLLMCSPFMHRIFTKPLGYAGDYEMVNMILRDPVEGASLFAKLLNVFILSQVPAIAHRNRVEALLQKLVLETNRVHRTEKICKIFSLGCGPAEEVHQFLSSSPLSAHAQFTLLDSSEETLQYTGRVLEEAKSKHQRRTPIHLLKRSVQQLLKSSDRPRSENDKFDFIYCAGLFDYLNDRVCKALISLMYDLLLPGGLLLITNVDPVNPIRNIMEQIYQWHLIYRRHDQLRALTTQLPSLARVEILAEPTSSNIMLEVRKP